uniref:Uncharacterized protein n=1 Tax=Picea sitchensis TaxID=3332 RepID=A9NM70_PICSI|nr:unknown [Picea sitchensis]
MLNTVSIYLMLPKFIERQRNVKSNRTVKNLKLHVNLSWLMKPAVKLKKNVNCRWKGDSRKKCYDGLGNKKNTSNV